MTLVLIANIALSAAVLAVILGVAAWAIARSHHEGRPVVAASGRRWMRHTISLRGSRSVRPVARPFAS
jgi:uncharacterized membrane protein YadS